MKLKKIPKKFRRNTFEYVLMKRINDVALHQQTKETPQGTINGYEVHKIRIKPLTCLHIKDSEKGIHTHFERLAGNEDFGNYGWSYKELANAQAKFKELVGDTK